MSFWRKLFGGGAKPAPAAGAGGSLLSSALRSPRIRLLLADGARFETGEDVYPLLNISDTGLGFSSETEVASGPLAGVLYLGEISMPLETEVVRQTGTLVGARFVGNVSAVRATLRQLFLEEIRATEMSEVVGRDIGGEGNPRWFYAPGNYELFFVEKNGVAIRLEMEWSGRVVMAATGEAARIGHLPPETRDRPGHAKAALVEWDDSFTEEERAKAIRILENVPGLEPARRGELVGLLRR